jgi:hypothetical protein
VRGEKATRPPQIRYPSTASKPGSVARADTQVVATRCIPSQLTTGDANASCMTVAEHGTG